MVKNRLISLLFLLLVFLLSKPNVSAQETLTGLSINSQLQQKNLILKSTEATETTTTLPFFDDFTTSKIYPNQQHWIGKQVL